MTDQTQQQTGEEPVRTGGERTLRDNLSGVDKEVNNTINDNPVGNRDEKRRSNFIDHNGDEDNNPNTDEGTYRRNQQQQ